MEPTQNIQFGYNKPNAQTRYALRVVVPERGHITQLNPDGWWETKITYTVQNVSTTVCNTGSAYRFGFGGHEKDNEIKGEGNSYDFGARIYDSRLGRWLSLDPLQAKYPNESPYNFVANSPIAFKEKDGKDFELEINKTGKNTGTIIIKVNVYAVSEKSAEQAQVSANELNSINATAIIQEENENGSSESVEYTVKFQVKVIKPSGSDEGSINQQMDKYCGDAIGNIFRGTTETLNLEYGGSGTGGTTLNGRDVQMNNIKSSGNFYDLGDNSDLVGHEFLHLMGLNDKDGTYYGGDGGRMEYVAEESKGFKMNKVSDEDVKKILVYAIDNGGQGVGNKDVEGATVKLSGNNAEKISESQLNGSSNVKDVKIINR